MAGVAAALRYVHKALTVAERLSARTASNAVRVCCAVTGRWRWDERRLR